ncbi:class I SAM-dependent methyltransferase [Geomonas sp.]|uniref:class I SAM-dependent methyltransferase n=1 Tax=Geomonas sp. TaxID=2651584 RepID=UPI002B472A34|nr:class I SAM-dependent methyltransferase [Geomonas sp.]HJV34866.1 class I SAM-dependent methyltransferase [Geomonas sp.]
MTELKATFSEDANSNPCRACGVETNAAFTGIVLQKIPVTYHACPACGTLQLHTPNWLDEAYSLNHYPDPDVSRLMRSLAVQRVIRCLRAESLLPKVPRCLDEGAGLGLLVCLLRDDGYDAWGHDPYAKPVFAERYISRELPAGFFDLITAIEVIEHTVETIDFVQELAERLSPKGTLLLSTELYDSTRFPDPSKWTYLAQDYGQHISFLSSMGLQAVAAKANLHWWASLEFAGSKCIHLLSKEAPSRWSQMRLRRRHLRVEKDFKKKK